MAEVFIKYKTSLLFCSLLKSNTPEKIERNLLKAQAKKSKNYNKCLIKILYKTLQFFDFLA
jgi:homoserine trans-succinylase